MKRQVLFKILILMCVGMWGSLIPEIQAGHHGSHKRITVLAKTIQVKNQDIKSAYLAETVYVEKLEISAQGVRNDASFEVMVNGVIKGTVYVPGRDPVYIVTVKESTGSIQFKGTYGTAKITAVNAYVSEVKKTRIKRYTGNYWAHVADEIINVVEALEKHSTYKQNENILFPIKRAGIDLHSVAVGNGRMTNITYEATNLVCMIEKADNKIPMPCLLLPPQAGQWNSNQAGQQTGQHDTSQSKVGNKYSYIEEMLQKEAAIDLVQRLLDLKEELKGKI